MHAFVSVAGKMSSLICVAHRRGGHGLMENHSKLLPMP